MKKILVADILSYNGKKNYLLLWNKIQRKSS